jgi:hypothetical protein
MTLYSLEKANSNKYTLWIGLIAVIVIYIVFSSIRERRARSRTRSRTRSRSKSRSKSRSRSRSRSRSTSKSRLLGRSVGSSFRRRIGSWFSKSSKSKSQRHGSTSKMSRRNKNRKQKYLNSSNRINSPNNVRVNSPNTAYFIHYNAPHLCHCKKHKHLNNKVRANDIDIDDLINAITKTRKTVNKVVSTGSTASTKLSSSKMDSNEHFIEHHYNSSRRRNKKGKKKLNNESSYDSDSYEHYSGPVGVGNLTYDEVPSLDSYYDTLSH